MSFQNISNGEKLDCPLYILRVSRLPKFLHVECASDYPYRLSELFNSQIWSVLIYVYSI